MVDVLLVQGLESEFVLRGFELDDQLVCSKGFLLAQVELVFYVQDL